MAGAGILPVKCHQIWIDKHLVPYTPATIDLKTGNNTEVIKMADDSFITVPKRNDPFEYSFEFKIPFFTADRWSWRNHDYAESLGTGHMQFWKDLFWNRKNTQLRHEPFEFVVERSDGVNTVELMLLKDYSFTEDAEDHSACTFSVTLMEYRMAINQELNTYFEHHLIQSRQARGWKAGRGRMGNSDLVAVPAEKAAPELNSDQAAQARLLDELAQDEYAQMVQDGRIPEWYLPIADRVKRRVHATDPWSPEYPDPFPEGGVDIPTVG